MKDDLYGGKIRCNLKSESAHFFVNNDCYGCIVSTLFPPGREGAFLSCVLSTFSVSSRGKMLPSPTCQATHERI
jgi:hypothetical protein